MPIKLTRGQSAFWTDPDNGLCSGMVTIISVVDDVATCRELAGGEVVCPIDELATIPVCADGLLLTSVERRALNRYATRHGRTWKQSLRDAWMTASEPGILQQLRNSHRFGPQGLIRYRPH